MTELKLRFSSNGLVLVMATQTFGLWLSETLRNAGLRQADLVERTGLSKSYISTLVGDKPNSTTGRPIRPEPQVVEKIARALGVPVGEARLRAGYRAEQTEAEVNTTAAHLRFAELANKYDLLPADKREVVDEILEGLDRVITKSMPPPTHLLKQK